MSRSIPEPVPRTVVMIHGMWCTGAVWDGYRRLFEGLGYRVLTPTLRHHDQSPGDLAHPDLGRTSIRDYVDDLAAEIGALPEKPVVIGHSMGGLLAQILAAKGLCAAAVFLTPAPPAGVNALAPSVIRTFIRLAATWGFWNKPVTGTFDEAVYAVFNLLPPERQRAEYEKMVPESGRAAAEIGLWWLDPHGSTRVDERRISCPVLTVGTGKDRITPLSVVRAIARKYAILPKAAYHEFPDHAHWVLGEDGWEEVAEVCARWIEKACGGDPS